MPEHWLNPDCILTECSDYPFFDHGKAVSLSARSRFSQSDKPAYCNPIVCLLLADAADLIPLDRIFIPLDENLFSLDGILITARVFFNNARVFRNTLGVFFNTARVFHNTNLVIPNSSLLFRRTPIASAIFFHPFHLEVSKIMSIFAPNKRNKRC